MAAEKKPEAEKNTETYGADYEILPHKDIIELREELRRLRAKPSERTLQISMVELAGKVDKLIDIFSDAMEQIRVEEGGLTFQEKMKPVLNRMEKILEQNSQIAEGIVALADMVNEIKPGGSTVSHEPELPTGPEPMMPPMPGPAAPVPLPPAGPAPLPPGGPMPPGPIPPTEELPPKPLPSVPPPPKA